MCTPRLLDGGVVVVVGGRCEAARGGDDGGRCAAAAAAAASRVADGSGLDAAGAISRLLLRSTCSRTVFAPAVFRGSGFVAALALLAAPVLEAGWLGVSVGGAVAGRSADGGGFEAGGARSAVTSAIALGGATSEDGLRATRMEQPTLSA